MRTNRFKIYMITVFKIAFNLTTMNPLIHWKLLVLIKCYIFTASTGMLKMLPLILENSPFPCLISNFLNNNILEIRTFSIFSIYLKPFYYRLLDMEFRFYKGAYGMFHIYKVFHQTTSLDYTCLQ